MKLQNRMELLKNQAMELNSKNTNNSKDMDSNSEEKSLHNNDDISNNFLSNLLNSLPIWTDNVNKLSSATILNSEIKR